jgi:hypothetical protein
MWAWVGLRPCGATGLAGGAVACVRRHGIRRFCIGTVSEACSMDLLVVGCGSDLCPVGCLWGVLGLDRCEEYGAEVREAPVSTKV